MAGEPWRKPRPVAGEVWRVSDFVLGLVTAGDVRVLEVNDQRVTFVDDLGRVGTFLGGTFAGLFDPPQGDEPPP